MLQFSLCHKKGQTMKQARIYIDGMTCINCQTRIENELKKQRDLTDISVSYEKGEASFSYNPNRISLRQITDIINKMGYSATSEKLSGKKKILRSMAEILLIAVLFGVLQYFEILNYLVPASLADSGMSYGMLFVIGMLTSVHCVAMCGGINLSQTLQKNVSEEISKTMFRNSFLYNAGRVVSYTVVGGILGAVGGLAGFGTDMQTSSLLQGILKLVAGAFMIIMGINMLEIFPWLRKFRIRIPLLYNKAGNKRRTPFIIGLCNGLMPCGPLQSVQIIALASGNPLAGAFSMFCFSIGTVPLMLGFGSAIAFLGKRFTGLVLKAGSILIVVMGLSMMTQGTALAGLNSQRISRMADIDSQKTGDTAVEKNGIQYVYSQLQSGKYPDIIVKAGEPVEWEIEASEDSINGCNYKIFLQDFGLEHTFTEGKNIIKFTPEQAGTYTYTCWMGMITGKIHVENN